MQVRTPGRAESDEDISVGGSSHEDGAPSAHPIERSPSWWAAWRVTLASLACSGIGSAVVALTSRSPKHYRSCHSLPHLSPRVAS